MAAAPWVRDGEGYRCTKHEASFKPPHACPKCVDDRGEQLDVEVDAPLPAAPKACNTSEEHERELTAIAKFADAQARKVAKAKKGSQSVAVKWLELAVKARRAASNAATRREDEEIVRARERRQRARDRQRPHGATN